MAPQDCRERHYFGRFAVESGIRIPQLLEHKRYITLPVVPKEKHLLALSPYIIGEYLVFVKSSPAVERPFLGPGLHASRGGHCYLFSACHSNYFAVCFLCVNTHGYKTQVLSYTCVYITRLSWNHDYSVVHFFSYTMS